MHIFHTRCSFCSYYHFLHCFLISIFFLYLEKVFLVEWTEIINNTRDSSGGRKEDEWFLRSESLFKVSFIFLFDILGWVCWIVESFYRPFFWTWYKNTIKSWSQIFEKSAHSEKFPRKLNFSKNPSYLRPSQWLKLRPKIVFNQFSVVLTNFDFHYGTIFYFLTKKTIFKLLTKKKNFVP